MILAATAATAAAFPAGEAGACLISVNQFYVGGEPTAAEKRAEARQAAADRLRLLTREAKRKSAEGADVPRELAEMLVPNVRAEFAESSDCGDGEVDEAGSVSFARLWEGWLSGTAYAGRETEFEGILRLSASVTGPACNSEVRDRFAAYLRRRLTAGQLRDAYVFLLPRRFHSLFGYRRRLMSFAGATRQPPVQWANLELDQWNQVLRWERKRPEGRALKAAVEGFWTETAPLLPDSARACPAADSEWRSEQAEVVKEIAAQEARRRPRGGHSPAS